MNIITILSTPKVPQSALVETVGEEDGWEIPNLERVIDADPEKNTQTFVWSHGTQVRPALRRRVRS